MLKLIPILLLFPILGHSATWYVDKTANGTGVGTSWANAWTSFANINWAVVNPGDTIYISGGPISKTYTSPLIISKSGIANQPITIAIDSSNVNHCGEVIFSNTYIDLVGRQYVTINGNVAGYRRFVMRDFYNSDNGTFANAVLADGSLRCKFDSMSASNVNNFFSLNTAAGLWVTNCVGTQIRGDAVIRANGCYGFQWDANIIERSDFECVVGPNPAEGGNLAGPDGVQTGNNLTVRYNKFRTRKVNWFVSQQHNDMFQAPGVYLKIHNNEFINNGDSGISLAGWWDGTTHDHVWIYNNLFHNISDIDPFPEFFRFYNNNGNVTSVSDWLIANNTFVDSAYTGGSLGNSIYIAWTANLSDVPISGVRVVNNIFVNTQPFDVRDNAGLNSGGFTWDHNVYFSGASMGWRGVLYNANSWSAIEPTRIVGTPTFAYYSPKSATNDFHLQSSDTVALNAGAILTNYFTVDFDGFTRTNWHIGAFGISTTNTPPPPVDPPPDPPSCSNVLSGWTWLATDGGYTAPFTATGTSLSQSATTEFPFDGGRACYTFTNYAGTFRLKLSVNAPNSSQNSFFIDINEEPHGTNAIWDISPYTVGYQDRYVSWRGAGTFDAPEHPTNVWSLAAGTNTLIIRGREANTLFRSITLENIAVAPPPTNPPAQPTGVRLRAVNVRAGVIKKDTL